LTIDAADVSREIDGLKKYLRIRIMTDTPDHPTNELALGYKPVSTAPFIYFDFAPTYGTLAGAIQVELAARTMIPLQNGGVELGMVETARLRCSPIAAQALRNALDAAEDA
jgi:hypothetical protein